MRFVCVCDPIYMLYVYRRWEKAINFVPSLATANERGRFEIQPDNNFVAFREDSLKRFWGPVPKNSYCM